MHSTHPCRVHGTFDTYCRVTLTVCQEEYVHSRIASYVAVIRAHESMTDGMKRKTCQANAHPMLPSAASQNEIAVLGSSLIPGSRRARKGQR